MLNRKHVDDEENEKQRRRQVRIELEHARQRAAIKAEIAKRERLRVYDPPKQPAPPETNA